MTFSIAIGGKGGSGKTTIAAMIIRILLEQADNRPILAVDADPNSCLGLALGVQPSQTIAEIREQVRQGPDDGCTDRLRRLEYQMQQVLTEADGFDLLTMGRPEGPSCYCAVNNMLRQFLDKLSSQYRFVVIDNEAGMEHLSRRTTNNVDLLCIVAEPTPVGTITAERIISLAKQLPITVKEIDVLWNKTHTHSENKQLPTGVQILGSVPENKDVLAASMKNKTVLDLGEHNAALSAVRAALQGKLGFTMLADGK
jgi:CO dehydrogenase maturation factor